MGQIVPGVALSLSLSLFVSCFSLAQKNFTRLLLPVLPRQTAALSCARLWTCARLLSMRTVFFPPAVHAQHRPDSCWKDRVVPSSPHQVKTINRSEDSEKEKSVLDKWRLTQSRRTGVAHSSVRESTAYVAAMNRSPHSTPHSTPRRLVAPAPSSCFQKPDFWTAPDGQRKGKGLECSQLRVQAEELQRERDPSTRFHSGSILRIVLIPLQHIRINVS